MSDDCKQLMQLERERHERRVEMFAMSLIAVLILLTVIVAVKAFMADC